MILITGATGLTGSHLALELTRRSSKVKALRRNGSSFDMIRKVFELYAENPEDQYSKIEWIEGDLLEFFFS